MEHTCVFWCFLSEELNKSGRVKTYLIDGSGKMSFPKKHAVQPEFTCCLWISALKVNSRLLHIKAVKICRETFHKWDGDYLERRLWISNINKQTQKRWPKKVEQLENMGRENSCWSLLDVSTKIMRLTERFKKTTNTTVLPCYIRYIGEHTKCYIWSFSLYLHNQ